MKTFKILFFIAISTFLLSCYNVIDDTDGDGISDTVNSVNDFYAFREKHYMQNNIRKYASDFKTPSWYKPTAPLDISPSFTSITEQYIEKGGVTYKPLREYIKTAEIYKITKDDATPANVGKFVLITLEPVPIFRENMVILLVSKDTYTTAANAKAAAELIDIPKIKMIISHLDLVFNPTVPESEYLSYENVDENVAAILVHYDLLEFFGTSYSYKEKEKLLSDYSGYSTLLK